MKAANVVVVVVVALCLGCDQPPVAAPDAGPLPPDEVECFANPTNHAQLINACTDAEAIDKNPTLPLLNADGTLPPLP